MSPPISLVLTPVFTKSKIPDWVRNNAKWCHLLYMTTSKNADHSKISEKAPKSQEKLFTHLNKNGKIVQFSY